MAGTPSTPTPRTARGRATRERILRAATDLVAERGVAATSLDDVRERAEASKSQLYLYFPDRDALLREVAASTCENVIAGQAEVLAQFDTMAGIERYLDTVVGFQDAFTHPSGCPIGTLAGQLADHDEATRTILAAGYAQWEDGLRHGLEAMADRGELRADADPALLATQTLGILQGGLLLTQVRRDVEQLRIATRTILALIRSARV